MKLYKVKEDYIEYLRNFDNHVPQNKQEKRVYTGVALQIKNHSYFIPMTSPKDKHKKMKSSLDFIKIHTGEYGALNINIMIPIKESSLIPIDIEKEPDEKYKNILRNQFEWLIGNKSKIIKNATRVYEIYYKDEKNLTNYEFILKQRCCKFDILQQASDQFYAIDKNK